MRFVKIRKCLIRARLWTAGFGKAEVKWKLVHYLQCIDVEK